MKRKLLVVTLVSFTLFLTGCTRETAEYQVMTAEPTVNTTRIAQTTSNTAPPKIVADVETDAPSTTDNHADWPNREVRIVNSFVRQNGMSIDLNMLEPASFPERLYEITLQVRNDNDMEITKTQALTVLEINSKDLQSNYLAIEGDGLQYSPYRRENNEFGLNSYPLLQPIKTEESTDTMILVGDNRTTEISQWKATSVSMTKVRTILQKSEDVLSQFGYEYGNPSAIYMSQLTDGTSVIEIIYPRYLEGLPMQSTAFDDKDYDPNSTDQWGALNWDVFHFIYCFDNEKLYYCNIERNYTVLGCSSIVEPMITYTQALQSLVSSQMELFTSKQFKNQRFVVYAVRPCYVKVPVKGDTSRFIAKPAWEIAYYVTDSNSADVYMDNFRWVTYVDARTGEVYGR